MYIHIHVHVCVHVHVHVHPMQAGVTEAYKTLYIPVANSQR